MSSFANTRLHAGHRFFEQEVVSLCSEINTPKKLGIATELIDMLMKMYDPRQTGIVGPRFQHNVCNAMMTVMLAEPGATLLELVRALTDGACCLSHSRTPLTNSPLTRHGVRGLFLDSSEP